MTRSFSDPSIEIEPRGIEEGCQCPNTVISVEDEISAFLLHQHARGRDLAVTLDDLLKFEKSPLAPTHVGQVVDFSENVSTIHPMYDALGNWIEANLGEGKFTEFPAELRDYLYAAPEK